ncbi:MAG: dihydroneopterin triphosphate diphosphatase [Candidatus Competibacteraceae bacterium]|nr:dihydroneopterin triphosphate diphosphatase [Candidatus Competibacteraceae bacterium]
MLAPAESDQPRYKRPASVLVVIYTVGGEVLVLRRSQPPDFWQSVTGSLRWEEMNPLDAARRELYEETGLSHGVEVVDCQVINRFPILPPWRHRYSPDATENTEHVFRVPLPERLPILLNPAEHSEYQWLPRAMAASRVSSWTNRDAILQLP